MEDSRLEDGVFAAMREEAAAGMEGGRELPDTPPLKEGTTSEEESPVNSLGTV